MTNYYQLCCKHRGKVVSIYERNGRHHYGRIVNIDRQYVYIEPIQRPTTLGGFSYGYFGGYYRPPYWGYGYGGAVPIALAAIGGFALASAFFLW